MPAIRLSVGARLARIMDAGDRPLDWPRDNSVRSSAGSWGACPVGIDVDFRPRLIA